MVLEEAKELFCKNNICFELTEYESEKEYWHHAMLFPYAKNAKQCRVVAIIIHSVNRKKDIELQFNAVDGVFRFEELRFGDYCYEMFDYEEEMLMDDLLERINEIRNGKVTVIVANDLKKKRWIGDACFDISDDDDDFGTPGFEKAMQRIRRPNGLFAKLTKSKKQYQIYDWNTYQCIVK